MRQAFILLIIFALGFSCAFEHKVVTKQINVMVIDENKKISIDSAQVILTSIIDGSNIFKDMRLTNPHGRCSYSFELKPGAMYGIKVKKKGYLSYFADDSIDPDKSDMRIEENTNKDICLYLTSDSMNQVKYWAKRTRRYEIDTLIYLLRSDKYRYELPQLYWDDIPKLLSVGCDNTVITNFPINPISSIGRSKCYLGTLSLWFIESIRIAEKNKIVFPFGKYPSQTPTIQYTNQKGITSDDAEKLKKAFHAYSLWWDRVKNEGKKEGCQIDPLENTGLAWR